MNNFIRTIAALLAIMLLLCSCGNEQPKEQTLTDIALFVADGQKALYGVKPTEELLTLPEFTPGISVCDWTAVAFKKLGFEEDYEGYLKGLEAFVTEAYATKTKLSPSKATEWHRMIIVASSLGADATAFGETPDGNKINLVADGTYNYINGDLSSQGVNAFIYALLALDSKSYEVPEGSVYTRESIIENILALQFENGAFGFGNIPSADITGMALQALASYTDDAKVKSAVNKAVMYLSESQNGNGSYSGMDVETSESIAQVVTGIACCGIDPRTDERFIKHKTSAFDALFAFQNKDGSFSHLEDDNKGDFLATEQALLAIIAVINLENGTPGILNLN